MLGVPVSRKQPLGRSVCDIEPPYGFPTAAAAAGHAVTSVILAEPARQAFELAGPRA